MPTAAAVPCLSAVVTVPDKDEPLELSGGGEGDGDGGGGLGDNGGGEVNSSAMQQRSSSSKWRMMVSLLFAQEGKLIFSHATISMLSLNLSTM